MMRVILWNVILVAMPFCLYWGYITFVARKKEETGGTWDEAPLVWLFSSGIIAALLSLAMLSIWSGEDAESVYRPAVYKDGVLVPGEIVTPSDMNGEED